MLVLSITKKGNNVLVTFDDNAELLLNYNVFIDSMLRRNDNIDKKRFEELKSLNELYKIKTSALNLLGRRQHSKRELYQKIIKKGFDKELSLKVLDDLSRINYLNDREFAEKFAEEKMKRGKCGINKIKADLIKKGIDKEIIQEIEIKYNANDDIVENVVHLAQRKLEQLKKKEDDTRKIKSKLYSHLLGKGFTTDQIYEGINRLKIE